MRGALEGANKPGWGRPGGKGPSVCLTMHQPWASLLVHGIKRCGW